MIDPADAMRFCSRCGSANLQWRIPEGDTHHRHLCPDCGEIHYHNPKVVCGCIPEWDDGRILLCRRAIEPRKGYWTLPAGFMENGETVEQGAMRETLEEADARVDDLSLYGVYSLPHISQVYMLFRGRLADRNFGPGPESLEVELRTLERIPWEDLAFPVIERTLRAYVEDRARGRFELHRGLIPPRKK